MTEPSLRHLAQVNIRHPPPVPGPRQCEAPAGQALDLGPVSPGETFIYNKLVIIVKVEGEIKKMWTPRSGPLLSS